MPTRTARTAWDGGIQDGSGQVELSSSKVGTYDVSFPKRAAENADGTTSPEELIAAAHSACFAMQLSANIASAGGTPQALEVTADVTLGPDRDNGGFRLTRRQSLQPHYARTLDCWSAALEAHKDEAIEIQSQEMYDRYMHYLTGCAKGFRVGYIDVNQFTLEK